MVRLYYRLLFINHTDDKLLLGVGAILFNVKILRHTRHALLSYVRCGFNI
jgi:hypothetical protein